MANAWPWSPSPAPLSFRSTVTSLAPTNKRVIRLSFATKKLRDVLLLRKDYWLWPSHERSISLAIPSSAATVATVATDGPREKVERSSGTARDAFSKLKTLLPPRTIRSMSQSVFKGPVYVVRDNIDTDQIIPAQYLNLIPTMPDEYEKLGSFALCGLPDALYPARFVADGK